MTKEELTANAGIVAAASDVGRRDGKGPGPLGAATVT